MVSASLEGHACTDSTSERSRVPARSRRSCSRSVAEGHAPHGLSPSDGDVCASISGACMPSSAASCDMNGTRHTCPATQRTAIVGDTHLHKKIYLGGTRRVLHRLGLRARLLGVVWGERAAYIPSISASKSSSDLAGRASRRRLAFALRLARALLGGFGASGATTGAWAGSTTTSILRGRSVYVSQAASTYCHQ